MGKKKIKGRLKPPFFTTYTGLKWDTDTKTLVCCVGGLVLIILFVGTLVVPYGDDYYYGIAFKDNYFYHKFIEYTQMNGRVLVHTLDELTLLFDTNLYKLVAPVLLIGSGVAAACFKTYPIARVDYRAIGVKLCVTLGLFLSLNVLLLRESYLWVTGMYNYLFPVAMVFVGGYFQSRVAFFGKWSRWYLLPAFLAGATTEQGGIAAISLMLLMVLFSLKDTVEVKLTKHHFALPCATCVGWLTTILAPGVFARMGRTNEVDFSEKLWDNFVQRAEEIMGPNGYWHIPLMLLGLVVLLGILDKSLPRKITLVGIFAAPIIMCASGIIDEVAWGGAGTTVACVWGIVGMMFAAVVLAKHTRYKTAAIFIITGLLTQGVMLPISGSSYRTTFGGAIFLIFAVAQLFWAVSQHFNGKHTLSYMLVGLTTCSIMGFLPTVSGYYENKIVQDQNILNTKDNRDGKIEIDTGIDPMYGFTQFYGDGFYYNCYRKYYGLGDRATIYYKNENNLPIYAEGVQCPLYLYTEDKVDYLPMRGLVEALGGTVERRERVTVIKIKGVKYLLTNKTNLLKNLETTDLYDFTYSRYPLGNMYVDQKVICDAFGLNMEKTSDRVLVTFKNREQ